jgi:hypothetical protein
MYVTFFLRIAAGMKQAHSHATGASPENGDAMCDAGRFWHIFSSCGQGSYHIFLLIVC